jgi:hypothetical protein
MIVPPLCKQNLDQNSRRTQDSCVPSVQQTAQLRACGQAAFSDGVCSGVNVLLVPCG